MPGGWWCCCESVGPCSIFYDFFDREGINPGPDWIVASGDWYTTSGGWNGALYEDTGNGLIVTNISNTTDKSQSALYRTIWEQVGNIYQLWLFTDETGSCGLLAEWEVTAVAGEYGPSGSGELRGYIVSGGAKTLVGSKSVQVSYSALGGRGFGSSYLDEDNIWCIGVDAPLSMEMPFLIKNVNYSASRGRAGIGTTGGVAIQVDEFSWGRLWEDTDPDHRFPCFGCICRCSQYDGEGNLIANVLFPPSLSLRIQGSCCTPWTTPCDTSGCPDIDVTATLNYESDETHEHYRTWWGIADLGCATLKIVFACDTANPCEESLPNQSWHLGVMRYNEIGQWACINDIGGGVILDEGWTCSPIAMIFRQHFWSLSGFPCCIPNAGECTEGDFTYTLTEAA